MHCEPGAAGGFGGRRGQPQGAGRHADGRAAAETARVGRDRPPWPVPALADYAADTERVPLPRESHGIERAHTG